MQKRWTQQDDVIKIALVKAQTTKKKRRKNHDGTLAYLFFSCIKECWMLWGMLQSRHRSTQICFFCLFLGRFVVSIMIHSLTLFLLHFVTTFPPQVFLTQQGSAQQGTLGKCCSLVQTRDIMRQEAALTTTHTEVCLHGGLVCKKNTIFLLFTLRSQRPETKQWLLWKIPRVRKSCPSITNHCRNPGSDFTVSLVPDITHPCPPLPALSSNGVKTVWMQPTVSVAPSPWFPLKK